MGAKANKTHTIASDVTNGSTFTTAYPTGSTQASLRGSSGAQLVYAGSVLRQGASPGIAVAFGASTITITNNSGFTLPAGSEVILSFGDTTRNGSYNVTVGGEQSQAAAGDGSGAVKQTLTASGAVAAATDILELNHATVVVAATMDVSEHQGLFIVRDTSASGTAAHTLTLTNGTFDGTNTVATLNAPGEALVVLFGSDGRGQIIENTGSVALS
jgi:hypothetical protein